MPRRQLRQLEAGAPFGARLRAARLDSEITQEKLARHMDVTLRTIQRWEDGSTEPRGTQLLLLAAKFGVEPGDLYPEPSEAAA